MEKKGLSEFCNNLSYITNLKYLDLSRINIYI